jgi:hypothetical protein
MTNLALNFIRLEYSLEILSHIQSNQQKRAVQASIYHGSWRWSPDRLPSGREQEIFTPGTLPKTAHTPAPNAARPMCLHH